MAGPLGFEPRTSGSAGRRHILSRLRAHSARLKFAIEGKIVNFLIKLRTACPVESVISWQPPEILELPPCYLLERLQIEQA